MGISSRFDENYSVRVGSRSVNGAPGQIFVKHKRYINTGREDPSVGASSIFWAEFDQQGVRTGVVGELIDNGPVVLTGSYLRRRLREDYGRIVEFLSHNRGRYSFPITLPDGTRA